LKRLWRRRSFALLVPAMTLFGLGDYSLFLWLPSYLSRMFGSTPAEVGAQLTIFQVCPCLRGRFWAACWLIASSIATEDGWCGCLPLPAQS
jgi:hypothetical protein